MLVKSSALLAVSLLLSGCSSDDRPSDTGQSGSKSSAGAAGSSGSAGFPSGGSPVTGGSGSVVSGTGGAPDTAGTGGTAGDAAGGTGGSAPTGGDGGGAPPDDVLVAPEALLVTPHSGGCGTLKLQAFTLHQGPQNLEMYVSLKNVDDTPACSPSFSVNLFDSADQQTNAVGGLLLKGFFRLKDSPDTTAACLAPGDVSMAALTDLPPELTLDDVVRVEYYCNFWRFEATPVGTLDVNDVKAVSRDGGQAYTGTLVNNIEVPLAVPGVAIFPLNSDGRPLGVANSRGSSEVPPGGSWDFETDVVAADAASFAAYPTPSL